MVVEITRVLKRPNRTKNYVRHMVVVATWWSGTLTNAHNIVNPRNIYPYRKAKQLKVSPTYF